MADQEKIIDETTPLDEGSDPKTGENDSSKAITGTVEGAWGGSVAGTNDAFEDADEEDGEEVP